MERVAFLYSALRVQAINRLRIGDATLWRFIVLRVVLNVGDAICARFVCVSINVTIVQYNCCRILSIFGVGYHLLRRQDARGVLVHAKACQVRPWYKRCVPYQDLAVIFVATVSIQANYVRAIRRLARPVLHFPELTYVIVRVGRILSKLISVYVIARIRSYRFAGLVGCLSMVTVVGSKKGQGSEVGRNGRRFLASRRVGRSLEIVRCEPKVVPTISFHGIASPFRQQRFEDRLTILLLTARRFAFQVGRILVIRNAFNGGYSFLLQALRLFHRLVGAPIVMYVFRYANYVLVGLRVAERVTRLIVVFVSRASNEEGFEVCNFHSVGRSFMWYFRVFRACSFRVDVSRSED